MNCSLKKHIIYGFLLFILLYPSLLLKAQQHDSIRIGFDQLLMLKDTIYYGINDSLILLETGTEYQLVKNILVRKPEYYKRKPEKKESVRRLHNRYVRFLMGQIHSLNEELPEDFNPSDNYYTFYKDRIIKEIYIDGVPILDGNLFDTTDVEMSGLGKFLNKTYSPTKERIIRNNLTFKANQKVNPRILSDNERLLRDLSYIEDARIKITPVEGSEDSVNVLIIVKDRYPIGIGGDITDYNAFEIEPYTRNLLGLGHKAGILFQYDGDADKKVGSGAYYAVNNMGGQFVNSEIRFNKGLDKDFFRTELEKPFITTNTKYGGELIFESLSEKMSAKRYTNEKLYPLDKRYNMNLFDLWLGYSFFFENSLTKPFLNIAGRFYSENYKKIPDEGYEYNYLFHDKDLYLASLSLQQVSYIKTSKLFQFGNIEDVPVGFNLNFNFGWEHTSFIDRPYSGIRFNYSKFYQNAGIFSTAIDLGFYRYNSDFEDIVTGLKLNYLSPISKAGRFELRNLFEIAYTAVRNPRYLIPIVYDNFEFDPEEFGIFGDAKLELNYHPVFYAPGEVAGFRFSFNPFINIGWIKDADSFQDEYDSYSLIGFTTSMKNESLIFPAMHIHMGYYLNEIRSESRFQFKVVFKDYELFRNFTSLKPKIAHPSNF